MPRVSGGVPNLINGVSQQPSALRLASQGELQVNCYSTVVNGLTKRPPSNHLARLTTNAFQAEGSFVSTHLINRDGVEQYAALASYNPTSGISFSVFDFEGNPRNVIMSDSAIAYLDNSDDTSIKFLTIADYTIVSNTNKVTQLSTAEADIEPVRPHEAVLNVKAGNYAKTYAVMINGTEAGSYETPLGSSASEGPLIDVEYIAEQLVTSLMENGYTVAEGWHIDQIANSVYIRNDTEDFTVETTDGFSGQAMVPIKDEIQAFNDLPFFCEDGMVVKVSNSESTEFDDYYVRFKADVGADAQGRGVWVENPAPGTTLALDADTMPHALIRQADGSFTLDPLEWNNRLAGSEEGLPSPSYIGRTLNDVFFYKNRLGFLSDENVIMSRNGDFFNFYRTTATDLLDDDPIDVAVTHNKVSLLNHAVAFQDRLILFSTQTQFQLRGNELLTPKTISLRPTTEFESSSRANPVGTGRNIYFPVNRGGFTMLREYFFNDSTNLADADDVTSHVPQYVQGRVSQIEASSHEDVLVCLSDDTPADLYIYKYLWIDNSKAQASWSQWNFPGVEAIKDFAFIESSLVAVVQRDGDFYLEKLDVQPGIQDKGSDYVTHLDRRVFFEGPEAHTSYDVYTDLTTFTLPYDVAEDTMCVTGATPSYEAASAAGLRIPIEAHEGRIATVKGDFRQTPVYFGNPYNSRYVLSDIHIRQQAPSGGVQAITNGRLQLHHMQLQFNDTGYFKVEVTPQARATRKYEFNGRFMGDPDNIVGRTVLSEGSFRFPVLSRNDRVKIEISSDSYLPFEILSVEWDGMFVDNTNRV